jgi:hypothetical protein
MNNVTWKKTVRDVLVQELRAHGREWLSGAKDQALVATTLKDVERQLLEWDDAALRLVHIHDIAPLTYPEGLGRDGYADLRYLAAKGVANNRAIAVSLRAVAARGEAAGADVDWANEAAVVADQRAAAGEMDVLNLTELIDQGGPTSPSGETALP